MSWQPSNPLPNKTTPREKPVLTNCKNCGAPLHGSVCEYCGTVYRENQIYMNVNVDAVDVKRLIERMKDTPIMPLKEVRY